jgi:4-diphosphocytidyl-2-C-methyl-D-erythritol kinase
MPSSPSIVEAAPAKLNLALHVRARRADGYHQLETLFVFARHGDTLRVTLAERDSFTVSGPFATALTTEGDNLVLRARDAFAARFGAPAMAIELVKNLPVASGVGGGSADAAAMLRVLARLRSVDAGALHELAAELGSDVPACLLGRTAIGRGRGEALEALPGLGDVPALLVNPGVAVSTPAVFAQWSGLDQGALPRGNPLDIARNGRNDLQPPAIALAPQIADVLALLGRQPGVNLVRMSGSGATCFALFEVVSDRDAAGCAVRAAQPGWWCLETALA